MDITIVGRHTKVNEDTRLKILEKMEKVESLAPRATRAEVTVVHASSPRLASDRERVEITVHSNGIVRAEASAEDRLVALDLAVSRILEQLRRQHDRRARRHQGKPSLHTVVAQDMAAAEAAAAEKKKDDAPRVENVETWEGAPDDATEEVAIDGTPIVIRSKTHPATRMTVAEAIDQMELVGHDFYLFIDSETELASVVYRRRGWTYGVIRIDDQEGEAAGTSSQTA